MDKYGLSRSISRSTLFEFCKRKYFFQYYNYHLKDIDIDYWLDVLTVKKLTKLPMRIGNIVHALISKHLQLLKNGESVDTKALIDDVIVDMDRLFELSKNRNYTEYQKNQTFGLIEHYQDRNIDQAFENAKSKVKSQYSNFLESQLYRTISSNIADAQGVFVEPVKPDFDNMKFELKGLEDIPIWAQADFAMIKDGVYTIYDWKTGQLPSYDLDHISKQLRVYALKTLSKLGFDRFEDIDIVCNEVFLEKSNLYMPGGSIDAIEDIYEIKQFVVQDIEKLSSLLQNNDPVSNKPKSIKHFPKTSNKSKCQSCRYIKQCRQLDEYI